MQAVIDELTNGEDSEPNDDFDKYYDPTCDRIYGKCYETVSTVKELQKIIKRMSDGEVLRVAGA